MTRTRRTYVMAAAVAAIVTAVNVSEGGYFSQSWGWIALAFLVPTTVLLILGWVTVPGRLRIAFAVLMGVLAVWISFSSLWSISSSASLRESERVLVYLALALAVAFVLRRGDATGVLAGVVLAVTIVCSYALATRLFPDRIGTRDDAIISYRLAEPLGYWNSLGLLATVGVLVAIGYVAHARGTTSSLAAAAAIPLLLTTLYFTFSRGAWAALVIGYVAIAVADPRRLRVLWTTLVTAVPSVVCIAYASRQDALTTEDTPTAVAAREGHRFVVVIAITMAASALAAVGARTIANRRTPSRRFRRRVDLALLVLALSCVVALLGAVGGPIAGFEKLERRFEAEPTGGANLNSRLFSASGTGRSEQLGVAWDAGRERPLVGQGGGAFEYLWYERRPNLLIVRDGHSLYMETFAELGVVGLALLGSGLLVLVIAGIRARRQRFAAASLGAFVAWMAASAFDWHWEMVGVTITALFVGAAGLVASERRAAYALVGARRLTLIGVTVVLSVFAVVSLVGNQALFAGRQALAREEWSQAADDARRARALLPWSFEPELVLGDAAAGAGDRAGALRAYRDAVAEDPENWVAWLHLAQVARGSERATAYQRVRELNPLEKGLPGE
jgi:O-Antigen ligase/Tetratricopeptide repeat